MKGAHDRNDVHADRSRKTPSKVVGTRKGMLIVVAVVFAMLNLRKLDTARYHFDVRAMISVQDNQDQEQTSDPYLEHQKLELLQAQRKLEEKKTQLLEYEMALNASVARSQQNLIQEKRRLEEKEKQVLEQEAALHPKEARSGNLSAFPQVQHQESTKVPPPTLPAKKPRKPAESAPADSTMAACLLLMDDTIKLSEWLAYHYTVLPLGDLIVAIDPHSIHPEKMVSVLNGWRGRMNITIWTNDTWMAEAGPDEGWGNVRVHNFSIPISQHRRRQNLFTHFCNKELKRQGREWVLHTDSDEFLVYNYRHNDTEDWENFAAQKRGYRQHHIEEARKMNLPIRDVLPPLGLGLPVASFLNSRSEQLNRCLRIPSLDFGTMESTREDIQKDVPAGIDPMHLLTLRHRKHGKGNNKFSKVIINLAKVPDMMIDIKFLETIHNPNKRICGPNGGTTSGTDYIASILRVNHYTGTKEAYFERRNDSREQNDKQNQNNTWLDTYYKKKNKLAEPHIPSDDVRPWIALFVEKVGLQEANRLLGPLNEAYGARSARPTRPQPQQQQPADYSKDYPSAAPENSCAILFMGLPRSYQSLVLPSIARNVLPHNPHCDYFVHAYNKTQESKGRSGSGGQLDPTEVFLLKDALLQRGLVHNTDDTTTTTRPSPAIQFLFEREEQFSEARGPVLDKIFTTKDDRGDLVYVNGHFGKETTLNIVKQWHSIQSVWQLMERAEQARGGKPYATVAILRSDVVFLTPVQVPRVSTRSVTVPGFALWPVNDRFISGDRDAVEVWANRRFDMLEQYVSTEQWQKRPHHGIHPESFLAWTIHPLLRQSNFTIHQHPSLCFVRARPGDILWKNDCYTAGKNGRKSVESAEIRANYERRDMKAMVEQVLERECIEGPVLSKQHKDLICSPPDNDKSIGKLPTIAETKRSTM